ncbi:nucleoporin-62 C-terminal-like protein [Meles meles]|uniref:nucleoporin-62 C-terminal-like protein n=1 Tax=Meles meles TaxID=9662 RepID=UPI001E69B6D3|nr:nucleoporin-62 C-terminal-like protein [Meles meles]
MPLTSWTPVKRLSQRHSSGTLPAVEAVFIFLLGLGRGPPLWLQDSLGGPTHLLWVRDGERRRQAQRSFPDLSFTRPLLIEEPYPVASDPCSGYRGFGLGAKQYPITLGDSIQPFAFGSATQSATATGFSFISGSTPQAGRASLNAVSAVENAAQPIAFAGLPLTPATLPLVAQLLHNQLCLSVSVDCNCHRFLLHQWKYTSGWEGQSQCCLCCGECSSTNSICRLTTHSCYSASGGTVATQPVVPFSIRGRLTGLASASTADATTCSSTMLFTAMSNASTSAAATGLSCTIMLFSAVGALTTSTGTFGGITLGFGLKVPGAGGAAHTASTTTSTTTTTTVTTTTTTTTTTSGFTLNLRSLTSCGINNIVPVGINSLPFTSTVNSIVTPVMTYGQLDGLINKWNLDLEDQEKYFLHQATQVNAWDRTLIENGEKITTLHGEVEKVKLDQQRLEQELDFILSQQKELEDLLTPLEEFVKDHSGAPYLQLADEDHGKTYKLAENIDAQLKRMAQDLKDIVEHLNTVGSPADSTDPLQQICKILNAHMDSLQWINQNSGMLQKKVEEVTRVFEDHRRAEQERNIRIAFD